MKAWQIAILVKPFAALGFWLVAVLIGKLVMRLVPEGRIKRLLSRRVGP